MSGTAKIQAMKPGGNWYQIGGVITSPGALAAQVSKSLQEASRNSMYPAGTRFRAVDENDRLIDVI